MFQKRKIIQKNPQKFFTNAKNAIYQTQNICVMLRFYVIKSFDARPYKILIVRQRIFTTWKNANYVR